MITLIGTNMARNSLIKLLTYLFISIFSFQNAFASSLNNINLESISGDDTTLVATKIDTGGDLTIKVGQDADGNITNDQAQLKILSDKDTEFVQIQAYEDGTIQWKMTLAGRGMLPRLIIHATISAFY